jgi:histidyl-tRNA synthetase
MGLPEGHPEKEGVSVDITNLVAEIKLRIDRKSNPVADAVAAVADLSVKTEDAGV